MRVRVVYKPDGSVAEIYPAINSRKFWLTKQVQKEIEKGIEEHVAQYIFRLLKYKKCGAALEFEKEHPGTFDFEPEEEWLKRVLDKSMEPQYDSEGRQINSLVGMPYDDVDHTELPSRESRQNWRGEKGKGIWVKK